MGSPACIQREHIDSLFVSDHLQIVPRLNGGLRRLVHFHINFYQIMPHMNVFYIFVQLTGICYSIVHCYIFIYFFFSASGRTDCKHDMVCVPSFLLAAAVLFGWEMF